MWPAILPLLGAGLTSAACYAVGALFIDRLGISLNRLERIALGFVLGASCLHLSVLAILFLHLGYWPVLTILLVAPIALAVAKGSWSLRPPDPNPLPAGALRTSARVCFAAFFILYLFNAWAPEVSPDGSSYHLGFVARYVRTHHIEKVTTNIYAMLGAGIEMLYVPAFAIGRHSAGALVHFSFVVALALAMFAYGRRIGKPMAGVVGAFLTFASPVVGKDGTSAYIDVGVAAIVFATFYWLEIWDDSRDSKLLIPIGLMAGYAFASKYVAFTIGLYALGFVLWKSRKIGPAAVVAGCAAIMAGPWVLRNWIWYQNPVAPMANWLFRNPYVHVMFEKEWSAFLRHYGIASLWDLPMEVAVRGEKASGVLGPIFLLVPLALLALRYRAGRRLLFAGLLVFATYFENVGTRFLIPALPFFSMAMALAFSESPTVLTTFLIFHALASWPAGLRTYEGKYAWSLDKIPIKQALRIIPQDKYLREQSWGYGVAKLIDSKVPKGERVLTTGGFPDSYTTHELLLTFQSGQNEVLSDILHEGSYDWVQAKRARVFSFPEKTVHRIRVTQIAVVEYPEQWNVHEMRFYDHGVEVPRAPEWRLRAWPNPWDVQMAFDNSPVTRWRSWETAFPGMYIDVDFGRDVPVDEVRLETSGDYVHVRLQVESINASGGWDKIAELPVDKDLEVPQAIRRIATQELSARGIHYLAVNDSDYESEDIREDPESWGLKEIGAGYGARLYQTIW